PWRAAERVSRGRSYLDYLAVSIDWWWWSGRNCGRHRCARRVGGACLDGLFDQVSGDLAIGFVLQQVVERSNGRWVALIHERFDGRAADVRRWVAKRTDQVRSGFRILNETQPASCRSSFII